MIDSTPAEKGGVGLQYTFRDRDKSKEIQHKAFSMYSPSRIKTFDQIKQVKQIPHEKLDKVMRKYEKMREKKAQSVLNNYSPKLQKVMETLPFDKISPPFMFSG